MKKLMTMIAAVATAFGLYATDFAKHTISFTGMTDSQYNLSENEGTTGLYWTYDGQTKDDYTPSDDLKVESNVLTIKTGSKVLSRKFVTEGGAALSGTNLFFDGYINFDNQALDEVPTLPGGEKLALFVLDTTDPDLKATHAGTNLYVIAGYGNGGAKKLYQLNTKVDAAFLATAQRVTIKAYETALAAATRPGFMIYINGSDAAEAAVYMYDIANDGSVEFDKPSDELNPGNDYLGYASSAILPTLSNWAKNLKLFLSIDAVNVDTLTSVDFVGNAKISSVTLTDEQPGFIPADAKFVTIATDPTDLAYTVTVDGDEVTPVDGKIYGKGGEEVVITVTSGLTGKVLTSTEGEVEDNVITYTFVVNDTITIAAVDAAAYVDGKGYATFGEALNAANRKGSEALLKLAGDYDADADEGEGSFKITGNVVLDLAGHTIKGTGGDRARCVIENGGTLTITNSTDTMGKVLPLGNNVAAVKNGNGKTLTIEAGMFDGEIAQVNTGTINVNDGSFLVKPEGATIPSTKKWCEEAEKVDGYWVLVDKPTEIDVPTAITGLVYTGKELIGVAEGEGYTLTGNTATDAGEYEATAALKPGYAWKTTFDGKIAWSIAKATATIEVADFTDEKFVAEMDFPSANVTTTPDGLATVTVWTDGEGTTVGKPAAAGTYTATVSLADSVKNYAAEAKSKTLTITAAEDPVIDPTKPGEPVTVEAKSETEAKAKATISVPAEAAAAGVAQTTYEGYFTKTAIDLGDNKWSVSAKLSDDVVKAAEETKAVATKLSDIAAATEGTSVVIPADKVKPGLYYTLKEGQALAMPEQSESKMAKPDNALTLPAKHYDGSGFYQLMVTTAPIVAK